MTYKEIFEAEKRRTIQDLYEIRFYKEGLWWKSFEWSVYLYEKFMSQSDILKDKKLLNNLKRYTVQHPDGSIVIIGMPIEAFDNFLPDIKRFNIVDENEIIFDLSKHRKIANEIDSYLTLDNYEEFLSIWKNGLPFTESSTKKGKKNNNILYQDINTNVNVDINKNIDSLEIIFEKIINYPLENTTPIENTQFIADIKQKLRNIYKI